MIADVLLMEAFGLDAFTWGSGSLIDAGATRKKYINALKAADDHDYSLLKEFVSS